MENNSFYNNSNFFIKVIINSEEFYSPIWNNSPYLYNIQWLASSNVPDNIDQVNISIELFDKTTKTTPFYDYTLTLKPKIQGYKTKLFYNIKSGHWKGDDFLGDSSGYGRLNSYNIESYSPYNIGYEIWFDIYQNDYDNDNIPYWTEVYNYGTDPTYNDKGEDIDGDLLPIEWEHKWMYNPCIWDNHNQLDMDDDSLTNIEEYYTSSEGSDPFRRDIFIEMDFMEKGPIGQNCFVSNLSKEILKTAFNRRNIVFHLDDGSMGGGGELITFDQKTDRHELRTIYNSYFLHNDSNNWRRSVFRYAIIVNNSIASGIAFIGENPWFYWHSKGINTFVISAQSVQNKSRKLNQQIDFIFAFMIMHETGHTFGIDFMFPLGCDNLASYRPGSFSYWLFKNYKSVMNYRYVLSILDYSDGSHGLFDHDDWSNLDFSFFEKKTINYFLE